MYSAEDGRMTDFHLMHYGTLATRGMGAICVEASAVLPEGRISPEDLGLWSDEQIKPAKRVVDFVHAQGTKIGVQLAHAGRKASMFAPWVKVADKESDWVPKDVGGWPDDGAFPSFACLLSGSCQLTRPTCLEQSGDRRLFLSATSTTPLRRPRKSTLTRSSRRSSTLHDEQKRSATTSSRSTEVRVHDMFFRHHLMLTNLSF